ncbi:SPOR domain-containing protein [Cytobacillus firmus]|uniref:SPOR domain-containing protein n=1 Tax=Cytobacillus firmus TaxID=1399 RepID=UPI0024C1D411|nr:SPOR domain-containing protein [Cytobacillus firmus]WHY33814.1 SPOR domain-containing protein [Cytobacillus firmus]
MLLRYQTNLLVIFMISLFLAIFPKISHAYTDLSTYRVEAGKFSSELEVKNSLEQLKADTGLNGIYKSNGEYLDYYRIISGGFSNESMARQVRLDFEKATGIQAYYVGLGEKQDFYQIISGGFSEEKEAQNVLEQFTKATGIAGQYVGFGDKESYYQIISGGFTGETTAKQVLKQFEEATGINGSYVGMGDIQTYYQIISGGYTGEKKAQQVLEQFKKETGINGIYVGIGKPQAYYQIISGGFSGESNAKKALKEFTESTNINANLVKIDTDRYRIISEDVLGMYLVNKGREFFKSKNWSVTYKATGKTAYEKYQVVSNPVLGLNLVNKGREFFKSNNWSVTYSPTGKQGYERYQVKSEPVLGMYKVNKGREFFKAKNWSVTYKATGENGYQRYRIESFPVYGMTNVNRGREFFKANNWSVTYKATGEQGYERYQVRSHPVLGMTEVNKGREFFKANNWSVTYVATGEKKQSFYIVIEGIKGFEEVSSTIESLKKLYGWDATAIKTKNGPQLMYTDYNITLNSMLDKQMAMNPQTDKYRNEPRYVHADFVNLSTQRITADKVNLRSSPSTADSSNIVQQLNTGDQVMIIGKTGDWVEVRLTWQSAKTSDVNYYLNPNNFSIDNKDYFQFLKLSKSANLNVSEVNDKILSGKGILAGKGQAFIEAANKYNINELYLISHSLLETGNGTSKLATGVVYNGRTVYNMYGYGAYDSCALECGAKKAYELGWFTPEAAIIGGAQFISSGYIYNTTFQQDTLYKMRWNPVQTWHQYATDIGWAYKQVSSIHNLYLLLDNYTLYYDVPVYK